MYYTVKYAPMFGDSQRFLVKAPDAYEALKKFLGAWHQEMVDDSVVIDLKYLHIERWSGEVIGEST